MERILGVLAAIALLATGCLTPEKLAKKCAETFPVRDSIKLVNRTFTDTIELAPRVYLDTVTVDCPPMQSDTVRITKVVSKTIPGQKIPIEVQCVDTVFIRTNTAGQESLKLQVESLQKRNHRLVGWGIAIILLLVIALILSFILRR